MRGGPLFAPPAHNTCAPERWMSRGQPTPDFSPGEGSRPLHRHSRPFHRYSRLCHRRSRPFHRESRPFHRHSRPFDRYSRLCHRRSRPFHRESRLGIVIPASPSFPPLRSSFPPPPIVIPAPSIVIPVSPFPPLRSSFPPLPSSIVIPAPSIVIPAEAGTQRRGGVHSTLTPSPRSCRRDRTSAGWTARSALSSTSDSTSSDVAP